MEDKSIIAISATATTENAVKPPPNGEVTTKKKKKKSRGAFSFIKAAMVMMRGVPNGKSSKPVHMEVVASTGMFKKIVGSMRPLHLQDNQNSPLSSPHNPQSTMPLPTVEKSDSVMSLSLSSPSPQHWYTPSSADSMSQYGSATNLQELDKGSDSPYGSATNLQELDKGSESRYASAINLQELGLEGESGEDEDESGDGLNDDKGGDEMIDAKAEEFIAQFYNQMKLQKNRKSFERY